MKKAISLFLALMMCLSLCACGTSAAKFQEAYTETYDKIETLNGSCEYVSSLMYDIWNIHSVCLHFIVKLHCAFLYSQILGVGEIEIALLLRFYQPT